VIPDLVSEDLRRLVVTSHPNHELAILGTLLRLRPALLFLTDGGAQARLDDTRRSLARCGLLDDARFLEVPEPELYAALAEGDPGALLRLLEEIRGEIARTGTRQVLCEAVELYNPLHDITMPLVAAAVRSLSAGRHGEAIGDAVEIVEFPLIAQVAGESGADGAAYRVQRPSHEQRADTVTVRLRPEELAAKVEARASAYPGLLEQLGDVLGALDEEHLAVEVFARARLDREGRAVPPRPGEDCALRYERRGELLRRSGSVERVITLRDHFLPAVAAVYEAADRLRGSAPA
jgi:hypothetical protein